MIKVELLNIKTKELVALSKEVANSILNRKDSNGRWELPEDSKWEKKGNELIKRRSPKEDKQAEE